MKQLIIYLLLLFTFALHAQKSKEADRIVSDFFESKSIPGLSVSVSQKGQLIFSKGYGYADLEQKTPVDPAKTKFRIGSVSKTVTAAGLARLYDEGLIDLDAPIEKYVPSWPKKRSSITLRQLAGHLAGIRHYRGAEFLSSKKYETILEGLSIFEKDPLINEPGTEYAYSSYGWNLISAAMETAIKNNGKEDDFLFFMQKEVFDALEMNNTVADHADRSIANRTSFYQNRNGELVEAPYVDNSYKWAGGGFIGTTEDLCRFGQAHMEEGYLKQETLSEWMTSQETLDGKKTNYGLGWRTFSRPSGKTFYGHSGGSVGGITYFLIHIPSQTVLGITANVDPLNYEGIQFQLMELFTE